VQQKELRLIQKKTINNNKTDWINHQLGNGYYLKLIPFKVGAAPVQVDGTTPTE
jgi:hypothetical protein